MRNRKLLKKLFSFALVSVFLMSVFVLPGTVAAAEEGDEEEETITYYDAEGNVMEDPYTADVCYDESGNVTDCPVLIDEEVEEDDDSDNATNDIPPGQMVRRGLSGPIVGVGAGYCLIETNFGVVKVYTDEDIDESMIGQKIAVKLRTREQYSGGTDETGNVTDDSGNLTDADGYYREAGAESFKIIPTKSRKEHRWGTVESTDDGCFFVDDEGNQIPIDCGNTTGDMIGLVGPQEGDGDGEPVLLQTETTSRIQERIQDRLAKAEEEGDTKTLERLQQQLDRYETKQAERLEKKEARAAARNDKAAKDKGKPEDKGNNKDKDK